MTPESFRKIIVDAYSYLLNNGFALLEAMDDPLIVIFQHQHSIIMFKFITYNGHVDYEAKITPVFFPENPEITLSELYDYFTRPEVDVVATIESARGDLISLEQRIVNFAKSLHKVSHLIADFYEPSLYQANLAACLDYKKEKLDIAQKQLEEWEKNRK